MANYCSKKAKRHVIYKQITAKYHVHYVRLHFLEYVSCAELVLLSWTKILVTQNNDVFVQPIILLDPPNICMPIPPEAPDKLEIRFTVSSD